MKPGMEKVAVGLGANLGDAPATIRAAMQALAQCPGFQFRVASRLYRSPAWGNTDQPDFINACVVLETHLPAIEVLAQLLAIEQRFGRTRIAGQRWTPRSLDLDLLLYGTHCIDLPQLKVPHPYLHQRGFALLPLAEIAPDLLIPGHGKVQQICETVGTEGIAPLQ